MNIKAEKRSKFKKLSWTEDGRKEERFVFISSENGIEIDTKILRESNANYHLNLVNKRLYAAVHSSKNFSNIAEQYLIFLFNGFSSAFLCACVCCSVTVLT